MLFEFTKKHQNTSTIPQHVELQFFFVVILMRIITIMGNIKKVEAVREINR